MIRLYITAVIFTLLVAGLVKGQKPYVVENTNVYFEKNRYAGWPANYGIWSWGDEIVTGFFLGYHDDDRKTGHPLLKTKPAVIRQARSKDGGKTWSVEKPDFLDAEDKERAPRELKTPINFDHPGFAFLVRFESANTGFSSFYYSYDRCRHWEGPFKLPDFNRSAMLGRTDYIVNGKRDMHVFLTAAKDGGGEGWPMVARTKDGGQTWQFQGWIGPQPGDSSFSIMTSTVRLQDQAFLTVARRKGIMNDGAKGFWLESFLSPDNGSSWYPLKEPIINNYGNPPHLIRLKNGRIALTYGYREAPYGIRAKISSDGGVTWSKEFILREDGSSWDIGYVRTAQRADGKLVTVYYYNTAESKERYIAATIWDPGGAAE